MNTIIMLEDGIQFLRPPIYQVLMHVLIAAFIFLHMGITIYFVLKLSKYFKAQTKMDAVHLKKRVTNEENAMLQEKK